MKNELEFVEMLKTEYHYPEAAIRIDIPGKFKRFDVLIQKGGSYIQAFEIKRSMPKDTDCEKKQLDQMANALNEFSVDTPIYFVAKNNNKWEIYAYNNLENPLDLESVLNYQDASRRFWGFVKDSVNEIPKKFNRTCWVCAGVLGLYFVFCAYAQIRGCIVPFDYQYLLLLCLIVSLVLFPFLLQMDGKIKNFKLGLFGWGFKE